jgi:hypothetical protein
VLLEFWFQHLSKHFLIDRLLLCWHFNTLLVYGGRFLIRAFSRDQENLNRGFVTVRVPIQNVTAILAIILAETPSELLVNPDTRLAIVVLLEKFVDLAFNFEL